MLALCFASMIERLLDVVGTLFHLSQISSSISMHRFGLDVPYLLDNPIELLLSRSVIFITLGMHNTISLILNMGSVSVNMPSAQEVTQTWIHT